MKTTKMKVIIKPLFTYCCSISKMPERRCWPHQCPIFFSRKWNWTKVRSTSAKARYCLLREPWTKGLAGLLLVSLLFFVVIVLREGSRQGKEMEEGLGVEKYWVLNHSGERSLQGPHKMVLTEAFWEGHGQGPPIRRPLNIGNWARNADMCKSMAARGWGR